VERPLIAAAVLIAGGAELLVVGSAALIEYGDLPSAADVDVVPECSSENLRRVCDELGRMAVPGQGMGRLETREVATVVTSYGPVDVLVERGRLEFETLRRSAVNVDVYGVRVPIASRADAWRLRRRHKARS